MTANKPYVKDSSVNARECRTNGLAKRLVPLIMSKHYISVIVFWPDMADIYYQSEVGVVNE